MTAPLPPAGWYPDPDDPTRRRWWDGDQWTSQRIPAKGAGFWSRRWVRVTVLIVAVILLLLILRPGGFLTLVGLTGLVIGIVAIAKGGIRRLRIPSRGIGIAVAAVAVITVSLGGGITAASTEADSAQTTVAGQLRGEEDETRAPTPATEHDDEVEVREVQETEPIPFERRNQDDPAMDVGATALAVAGVDGLLTRTFSVTYVDGVETKRVLASEVVTRAPVAELTSVGTRTPPPPPPPPPAAGLGPGCHASYTPCVPVAGDADCEGGGGNGPAYVSGPVRIIGPDVYELDRDGDGIACDR